MTVRSFAKSIAVVAAAGTAVYLFSNSSKQTRRRMKRGAAMTINGISDAIDDCRR